MTAYIIRRTLYAIPIVLGVVLLVFTLFFLVNTPEKMAQNALGTKATNEKIEEWIRARGYNLPMWYNGEHSFPKSFSETLLNKKCLHVLTFDLGRSDSSFREIGPEILRRMKPSLTLTVPTFLISLLVNITLALIVAFMRGTYLDRFMTVACVVLMSISTLFYIIFGQFLMAKWLLWFPISGFDWGASMGKFLFLPVLIGVVRGIGGGVRFQRTVMLEEVSRDYVRTARAKGLSESGVMFRHVLKNAMVPILTGAVMTIPFLFMGNLLMESFFAIPGLGSMSITAIQQKDYSVIRSMTYIGSLLFVLALLLTDISYTLVDPRIQLGSSGRKSIRKGPSWREALVVFAGFAVLVGVSLGVVFLARRVGRLDEKLRVPILPNLLPAGIVGGLVLFLFYARRSPLWRQAWRQVRRNRVAVVSLGIISLYLLVGLLDSVTWRDAHRPEGASADALPSYTQPRSVLDRILEPIRAKEERSYSAPLSDRLEMQETRLVETEAGLVPQRVHPKLKHPRAHLLGTDKIGRDVFVLTLKAVRTGLIVGGVTTLIAVPFAIFFGVLAGFFGGWVDDIVQYIYSTLSSIPGVLLIACFMLVFGIGLTQLCIVMGITGWVGLCRLLRAETLKLREREYVQASLALGASKFRTIARHIVPNLMHLVLISVILRFSGLVLSEAMLSYVGVGVGPDTASWGRMINGARSELARDPVVWWTLGGAFIAMLGLVLPANLFGDALRDALDPSLRVRGEGE